MVIPVYFDVGVITFDEFLLRIAEGLNLPKDQFEKLNLEKRKEILMEFISKINHPLIFADNYETISYEINNKKKQPEQNAVDINFFLNNSLPPNTSILLTSREKNNLDIERRVELEGLKKEEGREMFTKLVRDEYLKNTSHEAQQIIDNFLEKTGGHPLSIEIYS